MLLIISTRLDVFINCKHDGFTQVKMLYENMKLNIKIINIGSNSLDEDKHQFMDLWSVEKSALDKANHQLYYQGVDTTIVRFGLFDSLRVKHIDKKKMSIDYCVSIIDWVLQQKHRVKEITICRFR